jgi:hypothetical protein
MHLQTSRTQPIITAPESKDDCKDGGWREFTDPSFRNQGQCIAFVASGGRAGENGRG